MDIRFRRRIEDDLKAAISWYERQQAGLGDRFLDSLTRVLELLKEQPQLYGVFHRKTRGAPLAPFPYVLYYRPEFDHIDVVAIMHGGMNPKTIRRNLDQPS